MRLTGKALLEHRNECFRLGEKSYDQILIDAGYYDEDSKRVLHLDYLAAIDEARGFSSSDWDEFDSEQQQEAVAEVLNIDVELLSLDDVHEYWYIVDENGMCDPDCGTETIIEQLTEEQTKAVFEYMVENFT